MTVRVAIDFGTSSTCVVVAINGREPQVAVIDGQPLMSSAVYAAADGTLFVGQEAERQAAMDPSRYEPNPKRRIDEGELLLGDSVLRVTDVVHAVLARSVNEARRLAGNAEVDLLVLTHPADWGAVRTRLLRQAASGLAREVILVPEPVAAAVFHAATFAPLEVNRDRTVELSRRPGETLAVLDLGGGTVDVSVVSRPPANTGRRGFQVLATRGDPSFGGADIDQALLEHVGNLVSSADSAAWRELVEGRELADRRRRRVLRQDVRGAKETLSRHAYTDVPMPPPFADAHVTREDLEKLVAAPLSRAVEITCAAIEEAGLRPKQLTAIFLVGGSSRIPMISRLVHERTGVVPTTLDQPETVVARGALMAVRQEPERVPAGRAPLPVSEQPTNVVRNPGARPRPGFTSRPQMRPQAFPTQPQRPPVQAPASPPHGMPAVAPQQPPPERSRGKRRLPWIVGGCVVAIAAVTGGLVFWLTRADSTPPDPIGPTPPGKIVAQYHYQFSMPQDWTQTGGQAQFRETVMKPADAVSGNDAMSVQEYELTFDATADPGQLADNLRQQVQQQSDVYSGFNADATFAGRKVIYYRKSGNLGPIDWYVLAQGKVQVNVACQYATQQAHDRVASACDQVVRSLRITG